MRALARLPRVAAIVAFAACTGDSTTGSEVASSLRFLVAPSDTVAGARLDVTVELLDADSNRATGARDQVVLTVSDGSGFTGPSTVRASDGLAKFTGIALTHAGTDLYLKATAGSLVATTDIFTVRAAAASGSASSVSANVAAIVPTEPTPVVFRFADSLGNPIAGANVTVYARAGSWFTPDTGTTSETGTFSAVFRSSRGGSIPVSAIVNDDAITLATPLAVCANGSIALPGSATGSLSAISCSVSGRPTDFYRFKTLAGGAVFTITSAFTPRLEVTTDPPLKNAFATPPQGTPTEWLLPSGTYEVRVSAKTGTGGYSLNSAVGSGNSGCVRRFLATIGSYTGQALAAGDCDYGDGTRVDKYVVYSPNPCSFRLHSTTFTNYIFLMELGTGHFLDGRGGDDIGVDALFGMPSCSYLGGPVEIWVLPEEGEAGGAYTLTYTLFPIPAQRAGGTVAPLPHERAAVDPRVLRRLSVIRR